MEIDTDAVRAQLFRLAYVARNISYYRALAEYKDSLDQNFWIYSFNNFFDMSVLEWCKIFGSRAEPTHWTAVVPETDAYRQSMLEKLNLTRAEWDAYWEEMKTYRDNSVAHHAKPPNRTKYPSLDVALASTFHLYGQLVALLTVAPDPIYFLPRDLSRYYERSLSLAKGISSNAYQSSCDIEDKVR